MEFKSLESQDKIEYKVKEVKIWQKIQCVGWR
jgi:hypothetical protein